MSTSTCPRKSSGASLASNRRRTGRRLLEPELFAVVRRFSLARGRPNPRAPNGPSSARAGGPSLARSDEAPDILRGEVGERSVRDEPWKQSPRALAKEGPAQSAAQRT